MRIGWRDRLTDPWYVLPMSVLAGAVLALSLAIALEPDEGGMDTSVTVGGELPVETVGPTPTPDPWAHFRDLGRGIDAFKITQAAFAYYREHQVYPYNDRSGVQTLCADNAADAGCQFTSYLSPVPMDPRGDPAVNGYWYQSDGLSFTLFISMESGEGVDESSCPDPRPKELVHVAHLYCAEIGPPKQ